MDQARFDEITKSLSSCDAPRRTVVKGGAGAVLAALLGALGAQNALAGCKKENDDCDNNKECCSNRCGGNGKCRCSRTGAKCKNNNDCCQNNVECRNNVCQPKDQNN